MFCPNCGKEGNGNFCGYCGVSMETGWRYLELNEKQFYEFQFSPVLKKHYDLTTKENELYNQITKARDYFGIEAEQFICLAEQDIAIARNIYELCKRYKQPLPGCYSFKNLAILYENRREYDNAISVCKKAIADGYRFDGTKGGMEGRIKKLQRLKDIAASREKVTQ